MKNTIITIIVLAVLIFGGYFLYNKSKLNTALAITTYEACVEANYTVIEGKPNRCLTPDGRTLEEAVSLTNSTVLIDGAYGVNQTETKVLWEGRKKFIDGYVDRGTISVATSSFVSVFGGIPATTTLIFDMTSISVLSTGKGSGESMLTNHLKSDDFFNAEKYPTSRFVLKSVSQIASSAPGSYNVIGNLTIRDTTKEITIPANVVMDGDRLSISGEVMVNRADFGVKFGSTSFFKELADKTIVEDTFKLIFTVVADRK